jgi:KaiC/GvpD/RAD55 family RecA-like ATPase
MPKSGDDRVATGVEGLDLMIEGGFQKGSLVLLGGSPGTGKTEFATKFLCEGISSEGGTVLYVSLSEGRNQLLCDLKHRDPESVRLAKDRRFRFLDLLPMKTEAVGFATQAILNEVGRFQVKRLVIDSYSAIAQGFKDDREDRSFLQTVLHKIVRDQGCTTILISEERKSGPDVEFGPEEYATDAVLWFRTTMFEERLVRSLEIVKMRGTRLVEKSMLYSLEGGFVVFPPTNRRPSRIPGTPMKTVPKPGRFSTGIPDLDAMLGGGLPPSSVLLLSTDNSLSTEDRELFTGPPITSFLASGGAVAVIPPIGEGMLDVDRYLGNPSVQENWNERFALFVPEGCVPPGSLVHKSIVTLGKEDANDAYDAFGAATKTLTHDGRIPLLNVVAVDQLYSVFGDFPSTLSRGTSQMRSLGAIEILTVRPGLPSTHLIETLRSISDFHFKFTRQAGALIMYGVRPRTGIHVVEFDDSHERPIPRLRLVD